MLPKIRREGVETVKGANKLPQLTFFRPTDDVEGRGTDVRTRRHSRRNLRAPALTSRCAGVPTSFPRLRSTPIWQLDYVIMNAVLSDCEKTADAIMYAVMWGEPSIIQSQLQNSSAADPQGLARALEAALIKGTDSKTAEKVVKVLIDFKADARHVRRAPRRPPLAGRDLSRCRSRLTILSSTAFRGSLLSSRPLPARIAYHSPACVTYVAYATCITRVTYVTNATPGSF